MGAQLFVKAFDEAQYRRLDLFAEEPIKISLSVTNIVDPLAANSIFSRTFRVPHTSVNGPFFKAAFNVNATDFDASKKADAYINDQGAFFSVGNIRLSAIYVNEETNNVEYEINYYGETSDFGSKIGGGFLSEVNLDAYDHALNYNNVTNSWTGGLLGGDVVYPLIEWGYRYNSDNEVQQGTMSLWNGTTSLRGFVATGANATRAIDFKQLKPTLKAKVLWDAIFEETGYTYESTFLETDNIFTNLFVVADNQARTALNANLTFEAYQEWTDIMEIGLNGPTSAIPYNIQGIFTLETDDPSNSYSPTTSIYKAKSPGTYTFTVDGYIDPIWSGVFNSGALLFKIVDVATGTVLSTTSPQIFIAASPFNKSMSTVLTVGQEIRLEIESIGSTGNNFDYASIIDARFKCTVAPNIIAMSSFMPSNIRKVDFMRSIINRFRLVFVPSKDNEKHFEITPWKDWVLQGSQRDWTHILDGSKDMKITPLFYTQDRLQVFKDLEDADFVNYNYQLAFKQTYGQLNNDSNNELIKGVTTYQDEFAPMPLFPIGNVDPIGATQSLYGFLIPHIAKDTDNTRDPIQPKLRLGYYNGLQPVPTVPAGYQQGFYILNNTGVPQLKATYPLMSQFNQWPVTTATYDLAWENEDPVYDTAQSNLPRNRTGFDTYNTFWKTWYDTTFDPFSRIVEANFLLSYQEVLELKFNDYIWVKDSWYFVNKITDYVIGEDTNCRVELVKVGGSIGLVIPPSIPILNLLQLCFAPTACGAFCCNSTAVAGLYYGNGTTLATSTSLYQDQFGNQPVANGFYSDGTTTVNVVAGVVVSTANTSDCICNPPTLYPYTVCRGLVNCDACCCENGTMTVWGSSPIDLISSQFVFNDSAGTLPSNGWFLQSGEIYTARVINGTLSAVGICDNCDCDPVVVYPHEVVAKSTDTTFCDVCCDNITETVYTDSAVWIDSTVVYSDNVPLTLYPNGRFRLPGSNDVLITDASGNVISIGNCSSCTCLNYYRARNCDGSGLIANFSYPTPLTVGQVVSSASYFGQCWQIYGPASDGLPIDFVYDSCDECAGPPAPCDDCTSYGIDAAFGGTIQYIDCATGDVYYLDLLPGTSYSQCACRDSVIVLEGKVKVYEIGPCDTPENEFVVVSGGVYFTTYDGHTTEAAALVKANGDVDNTFTTNQGGGVGFNTAAVNDSVITDDAIWLTGSFTSYNGTAALRLIKLTQTGAIDSSYDSTTGFSNGSANSINKFNDGALAITGTFTTYKGTTVNRIVGIQPDGTIDSSFDTGSGFNLFTDNSMIKNDVLYVYTSSTSLLTYKGSSGSRFVAIDRTGNRIANFSLSGTDVPNYFSWDVDNLGRVYIAYIRSDYQRVIIQRWLSDGSLDGSYVFDHALPDLQTTNTGFANCTITVNDSYECFVTALKETASGAYVLKARPDGSFDTTFNTNQITYSGTADQSLPTQIQIFNNSVYICNRFSTSPTPVTSALYNGNSISNVFRINQTTGALDTGFNNSVVVNTPAVRRISFKN